MSICYLQKMLTITLGLPPSMKGNTIGLTGVYDDDQDNDFTWPNATGYISVNSTESEVFEWASLCKLLFCSCYYMTSNLQTI